MDDIDDPMDEDHALPQSRPCDPPLGIDMKSKPKRNFTVCFNQVTVSGGNSRSKNVVDTVNVKLPDGSELQFAHVQTGTPWFRNLLGDKGRFRFINVLAELRRLITSEEDADVAAVAADANDDEPDPMDALSDVEADKQSANLKRKRRRIPSAQKSDVAVVRMPTLPPCVVDRDKDATVDVRCLKHFKTTGGSAVALYVCVHDLTWLLDYAKSELEHLSVGDDDPGHDSDAEASAVSDFTVHWDFERHRYNATIKRGEHAGEVSEMDPDQIGGRRLARSAQQGCAHSLTKREAAKQFLEQWCRAVIANEVVSFEADWSETSGGDTSTQSSPGASPDSLGESLSSSQLPQSQSPDASAVADP